MSRRDAGLLVASSLGALVAGCGPERSPRLAIGGRGSTGLEPPESRLDLVPGAPLFLPVRVTGSLPGSFAPRVTLSDGRQLEADLLWIGIVAGGAAREGWLPAPERWVVARAAEGSIPASAGSWHVVASIPPDAAGPSLRVGDRTVRVNWLAPPAALQPASVGAGEVWEPWRPPEGIAPPTAHLLEPEWASPLRRWRAKMATGAFGLDGGQVGRWSISPEGASLTALAELVEARWRVGLARLWYADQDAWRRLTSRLVRTVVMPAGVVAPAWPAEQATLDLLLADLLDPTLRGEAITVRSDAWLNSLPRATAWVENDAAFLADEPGGVQARLRAALLHDRPGLLWVAGHAGARVGDPQPLLPGSTGDVIAPVGRGRVEGAARTFSVHSADGTLTLAVLPPQEARPPGARCGPLLRDWTMQSWIAADATLGAVPAPEWAAAALLYRDASGLSESGWWLFIECAAPEGAGSDIVRAWFGPRGEPSAVLRVSSEGVVLDERRPEEEMLLGVSGGAGRWSITLPVPRAAIEPEGYIRLGLTRVNPLGTRTAWPRRLMPWDEEPARAAIDVRGWSGLHDQ